VAEDYDIIIVGSGAGGGTLAHTLAHTGLRILIVERGGFLLGQPAGQEAPLPGTGGYAPSETWYDAHGRPFQPAAHYYVGGATKLYGAALSRLRPMDFGRLAHMDGESPAWPVSYSEFEPWYSRAEWLYQVHGRHGEDPTEGAWSADYLWPPVEHEPVIQRLSDELTLAGYQPFHTPIAMLPHAKADADVIAVRPLLDLLDVTLLTGAEVTRLETDPRGRAVTGVVVKRGGCREVYRGDVVVLAAGVANSARILLRSASSAHPGGLANGSGLVGRNLMVHNHIDVVAAVREPYQAVFPQTLAINDFYLDGRQGRWPLGSIQVLGESREVAIAFRLTTEDLPRPANRVTVDGQDRVSVAHVPTGDGAARLLFRSLRTMLGATKLIAPDCFEMPCGPSAPRQPVRADRPDCAHYAGTCRFGHDPATSVLDANCRAHELDNMYVVDASFLPSIGAASPALTVMANAIRVGEHIAARLGCSVASQMAPPETVPRQAQPGTMPTAVSGVS
jgi:choline dehydrogenase-like flavoprotein